MLWWSAMGPPPLPSAVAEDSDGLAAAHPAFYEDDVRYHKCNVCAAEFNIPPPHKARAHAELHRRGDRRSVRKGASSVPTGCSGELERQMETMHPIRRLMTGYPHWIKGVYLIVDVRRGQRADVAPCAHRRQPRPGPPEVPGGGGRSGYGGISLEVGGKKHTILAGVGSFKEVKDGDVEGIKATAAALKAPAMLVLASETGQTAARIQ